MRIGLYYFVSDSGFPAAGYSAIFDAVNLIPFFIMMKNKFEALLLLGAFSLLFFSCKDEQEWKSDIHELQFRLEGESALIDEPFEVTDLSLGIVSRAWTFEDGVPAGATEPVVNVSFTKQGKKKCSLSVVYDNGRSETQDFFVEVKSLLTAELEIPALTPMGCVPVDRLVRFDLRCTGEPTSFEWTFPGGEPAVSAEQSPSVRWSRKGDVEVSVVIKRETDQAEKVLKKTIHVGPYPMLRTMTGFDTDSWAADAGKSIGYWIVWNGSANIFDTGVATRCNGGAYGTEHAIRIDYDGLNDWQFFPRDMWVSNAKLEKGKKYEFTFYAKSDRPYSIGEMILINATYDYMFDAVAQSAIATGWADYYPDIPLVYQTTESRLVYDSDIVLGTEWKAFCYEFEVGDTDITGASVPDRLLNTYPFFVFKKPVPESPVTIFLDQIEINLLEDSYDI